MINGAKRANFASFNAFSTSLNEGIDPPEPANLFFFANA
jgi:hypothetical protein